MNYLANLLEYLTNSLNFEEHHVRIQFVNLGIFHPTTKIMTFWTFYELFTFTGGFDRALGKWYFTSLGRNDILFNLIRYSIQVVFPLPLLPVIIPRNG